VALHTIMKISVGDISTLHKVYTKVTHRKHFTACIVYRKKILRIRRNNFKNEN
jgi:hypothetical protein